MSIKRFTVSAALAFIVVAISVLFALPQAAVEMQEPNPDDIATQRANA